MNKRSKLVRDSGLFFTGSAISLIASVVRNLIVAAFLGPAQLGIWNLMTTISLYAQHGSLGIAMGMNKAIPVLRARGSEDRIEAMKDSVLWATVLAGLFECALMSVVALFAPDRYAPTLRIVGGIILFQLLYQYLFMLLRSDNRFAITSEGLVCLSVSLTGLTVVGMLVYKDRLLGGLLGWMAGLAFTAAYVFLRSRYRFRLRVSMPPLKEALATGAPLVVVALLATVLPSVDRWVIAGLLTDTKLGYYALGAMVSNSLALLPVSAANVLYPRMLERYGETSDPQSLRGLVLGPTHALGALMVFIDVLAIFILPVLVYHLFPKYGPAIVPARLLIVGSYFYAMGSVSGNYLVAVDRQRWTMVLTTISIVVAAGADLAAVRLGYDLNGVAIGTAISFAVYGLGIQVLSGWLLCGNVKAVVADVGRFLAPWVGMVVLVFAAIALMPEGTTLGTHLLWAGARTASVFAVLIPLVWLIHRGTDVETQVRSLVSTLRNRGRAARQEVQAQ